MVIDRRGKPNRAAALHKTRLGGHEVPAYPLGQWHAALTRLQRWLSLSAARLRRFLTLAVRVILLRRLGLALRQYNLTLELLELGLQLVQLAVRLFHDRRYVGQRFTIGRNLPQLLGAGLYLQLLQQSEHTITFGSSRRES